MAHGRPITITHAKAPCKGCEKRSPGCHGDCEAYAAFNEKCKELREQNCENAEFNDYLSRVIRRMPGRRIR